MKGYLVLSGGSYTPFALPNEEEPAAFMLGIKLLCYHSEGSIDVEFQEQQQPKMLTIFCSENHEQSLILHSSVRVAWITSHSFSDVVVFVKAIKTQAEIPDSMSGTIASLAIGLPRSTANNSAWRSLLALIVVFAALSLCLRLVLRRRERRAMLAHNTMGHRPPSDRLSLNESKIDNEKLQAAVDIQRAQGTDSEER